MRLRKWHLRWKIKFSLALIVAAVLLHLIYYLITGDREIFSSNYSKFAFIPINIVVLTLIVSEVVAEHHRQKKIQKLNIINGPFFSEVGSKLLGFFSDWDPGLKDIKSELKISNDWEKEDFSNVIKALNKHDYEIDIAKADLAALRKFLVDKRDFLLRLIENPNLLEEESFTRIMQAIFHLYDELINRKTLIGLPDSDLDHLAGDIKRAYSLLVHHWIAYMRYLKSNYPYLFSLAMRTNPFDKDASPIIPEK